MKVLFAVSEAAPFAKTGGLADVAGSLPIALASLGHDVRVVMPRYRQVDKEVYGLKHLTTFPVPLGTWHERCDIFEGRLDSGVTVYFVDKDIYFDRPGLYRTAEGDYPDNAERFIFFSRAILELCPAIRFAPDIIHCNDWQTGLVPLYLKTLYQGPGPLRKARTVFTVHNLGYQGQFWHWDMQLTGLGWEVFTSEGIEFWGKINFLKAGIVYSDHITTVSKTYGQEIQTPEYGHGLDGVLRKRATDLSGIVNGIDYRRWDPSHDRAIAKPYSGARLSGKRACKLALQTLVRLPITNDPIIGMVTRLVDQKGLDILTEALPSIMALGIQLVILGDGDEKYHRLLTDAAERYRGSVRVLLRYDDDLAKKIYAGCDLFLMPSRYEPCGLGQMNSLRYGTVPVVRRTGGLADTVADFDPRTGSGTGFLFEEYSSAALVNCLLRVLEVMGDVKMWKHLVRNGMKQDFSWERSAKEYVKVYRKAMKKNRVQG
jgi:starch synthase